jgi:hypothetical protein
MRDWFNRRVPWSVLLKIRNLCSAVAKDTHDDLKRLLDKAQIPKDN